MTRALTEKELAARFPALVGTGQPATAEPHPMAWRIAETRSIQASQEQRRAQQEKEQEMAEKGRLASVAPARDAYYAEEQALAKRFVTRVKSDQEEAQVLTETAPLVERYPAIDPRQGAPTHMAHYVAQAEANGGGSGE